MKTNDIFPIHDKGAALAELGKNGMRQTMKAGKSHIKGRDGKEYLGEIRARFTGEKRPPKAGEFYLSGAIVEAYQAKNDLDTPYHIAKIVIVKSLTTHTATDLG